MDVNKKIKDLRKMHGVLQKDIAAALGLSQSAYSYKETSGHFDLNDLNKIAEILGISVDEFTGNSSVKELSITDALSLMTEKQLMTESMLRVCLKVLAELWAERRKVPVTTVLDEMTSAVSAGTKDSFHGL